MTKVSIIVPFHNVEKYISKCLTSLMYQSLEDIEIICINDASEDASKEIVQKYIQNDSRIIMLHTQVQSGQSYARNLGLEAASGEYIGFADSDDWCALDMFEKLYNKAKEDDADITMCGAQLYDDAEQTFCTNDYYSLKSFEKFRGKVFNAADAEDEILNNPAVLWNKIYRADFLYENKIKFQEGFIYEDLPFAMETFLKAQKMNIVFENLYFYRQNRRFSTMKNSDKKVYDRIPMDELTWEILRQADFYEEKKAEIISWLIDDIFHRYTLLEEKYYQDYYKNMKEFFIKIHKTMTEKDREVLAQKSYCRDEFDCIVQGSYLDFWRFLIEKYKTANQKIKEAEHHAGLDVKAVKDYLEQYKQEQEAEKKEINEWWQKHLDETTAKAVKAAQDEQFIFLQSKKDEELKKLYNEMQEKLSRQEYELKSWQAESERQIREKLTADYEWKLEDLRQKHKEALLNQKNFYENKYLLVKILLKLYKKIEQLKNKAGKILKKNQAA